MQFVKKKKCIFEKNDYEIIQARLVVSYSFFYKLIKQPDKSTLRLMKFVIIFFFCDSLVAEM